MRNFGLLGAIAGRARFALLDLHRSLHPVRTREEYAKLVRDVVGAVDEYLAARASFDRAPRRDEPARRRRRQVGDERGRRDLNPNFCWFQEPIT